MTLRFHEIAESRHRILNPLSRAKLELLGEICAAGRPTSVLDLCCGKAEMLCTWATRHLVTGVGVDISAVFIDAARRRAAELGVEDRITLVHDDAVRYLETTFADDAERFDVVACIGATWIGAGLVGTLDLMRPKVTSGGLVAVGEPYWIEPLPDGLSVLGVEADDFASLAGTVERFESVGFEVVEMVLSNQDDWDRYMAAQWMTVDTWLRDNADHVDAPELRQWMKAGPRSYLEVDRRNLGWGVFVARGDG
jgi:SAM-dependent methyltransferase